MKNFTQELKLIHLKVVLLFLGLICQPFSRGHDIVSGLRETHQVFGQGSNFTRPLKPIVEQEFDLCDPFEVAWPSAPIEEDVNVCELIS